MSCPTIGAMTGPMRYGVEYRQHMPHMRAYTSHSTPVSRHMSQISAAVRRAPTPQEWGNEPELVTDECLKPDRPQSRMSL